MSEERTKILEMLQEGKITVGEAEKLLSLIAEGKANEEGATQKKAYPKYLRVMVEPGPGNDNADKVNIRVPIKLIRAGLKLASFIPKDAQGKVNDALSEKGIDADFSKLKPEDLDEILIQLNDLTVDVEGKEKVRVFCE